MPHSPTNSRSSAGSPQSVRVSRRSLSLVVIMTDDDPKH